VDLSSLTFMESTALQVLVSIRALLAVRGGTLLLVAPQPVVARILELTGTDQLIPVYDRLADAQAAE
jgi:anti-anti-sigma factor